MVLGALPLRQFAESFPLSGGCFGEGVGGDLRGVRDWQPFRIKSGEGVTKRASWGEQTETDPCSPLECSSWLMFETMVALVPEP